MVNAELCWTIFLVLTLFTEFETISVALTSNRLFHHQFDTANQLWQNLIVAIQLLENRENMLRKAIRFNVSERNERIFYSSSS